MNNERYNQIIDEVYEDYYKPFEEQTSTKQSSFRTGPMNKHLFINRIKTDKDFSERWGLKIEERELCHQERSDLKNSSPYLYGKPANGKLIGKKLLDSCKVPTRVIKLTYNNETIKVYE